MFDMTSSLAIRAQYLDEPTLVFADGREHVDPKLGISRFGPKSYSPAHRHPSEVRVAFIGTAKTIEASRNWLQECAKGVPGDEKHPEFPGYMPDRGFFSELKFDVDWIAQLFQAEVDEILGIRRARDRFERLAGLLDGKLAVLARKEQLPTYIVLALPDELYRRCRVVNYKDQALGDVHRDLRRAFKATAMKYRIPTQLLREQTVDGREKDKPSKVAWNFFTGLYFKAGGTPWGPTGLTPGTCYIGISFYRPLGSKSSKMQTSLVQAFDEHGDGLVLRAPDQFEWNLSDYGNLSPHLDETQAENLINFALNRYQEEMHQTPQRVVVHKSSQFWKDEKNGFKTALSKRVKQFDLLSLSPQSRARLLPANKYPPLRGTRFTVGDIDYLYTTGFISDLGQFHSLHVPSPIQITDHVGQDTPRETLLREVLALTKMNWNSARLGGLLPITLRFSDLVGEIMREIPIGRDPLAQFKYYM
jgi:hypothetical protein